MKLTEKHFFFSIYFDVQPQKAQLPKLTQLASMNMQMYFRCAVDVM